MGRRGVIREGMKERGKKTIGKRGEQRRNVREEKEKGEG